MAAGPITQISDVVVPEVFGPYVQQLTQQKSRLIQSGVVQSSEFLNDFLTGGGLTVTVPSFKDLDDDDDRVSTDTSSDKFTGGTIAPTPNKIGTASEIAVRLNRNNSWSTSDLTAQLAGADPLAAIGSRVADYWVRRMQKVFVATMNGIIADNAANDGADYQNDISGASYSPGVTDFSAEAFVDAAVTMGDSLEDLTVVMVHSIVYARILKNNLIDFVADSNGALTIPTFMGRQLIVDDGMPRSGGVYDSWLFGPGFMQMGNSAPPVPIELDRQAGGGNGGGQDTLYSRQQWCFHPTGHAYTGTAPKGGPTNAATTNNLAAATSWDRVYTERKQIPFARLVTRES